MGFWAGIFDGVFVVMLGPRDVYVGVGVVEAMIPRVTGTGVSKIA